MDISRTGALERIARTLAGVRLSRNAEGEGSSVSAQVDATWRTHLDEATAVLSVLREPDAQMAAIGDAKIWTRMVRAALGEDLEAAPAEARSLAEGNQTYQKPLG